MQIPVNVGYVALPLVELELQFWLQYLVCHPISVIHFDQQVKIDVTNYDVVRTMLHTEALPSHHRAESLE